MVTEHGPDEEVAASHGSASTNTLVLDPAPGTDAAERRLATTLSDRAAVNVLAIAYRSDRGSPARYPSTLAASANEIRTIRVDSDPARSDTRPWGPLENESNVERVRDPTDLSRLGRAIARRADALARSPERIVVWFDSLTPLLDVVGFDRGTKFLTYVTSQFDRRDVAAYYRVDPTAHDRRSLEKLVHLVDRVVDVPESASSRGPAVDDR